MCLSPETILAAHRKVIARFGGIDGTRESADIEGLAEYAEDTALRYGWDDTERFCLAVYQIVKKHPFLDGNKRTAMAVLLNCLRKYGYSYTGRPKDLAVRIEDIAKSASGDKENVILDFSYFLKARLQKVSA